MLPHRQPWSCLKSAALVLHASIAAMRLPCHVESGVRFDRYLAGLQGSVVGGSARCEGLKMRGKMKDPVLD